MPYPTRRGGGGGFPLGIEQNTFDAGTGDKAAAELLRDNYATANPDWLTYYDENQDRTIELLYIDSGDAVAVRQSYINSLWVDQRSTFGARGLPGSGTDFSAVSENHIPAIGPGPDKIPYDSGARVLDDGTLLAPRRFAVESGSIDVGPLLILSEAGGFVGLTNNVTGAQFNLIDFIALRNSPSGKPRILELTEAENEFIVQGNDSEILTANPLSFSYTTTLTARTNSVTLRCESPMSNVRVRVTDSASGVTFKYLPDRASWLDAEDGYNLNAGDNVIDLGDSPLPLESGRVLDFEIRADSVSLRGDIGLGVPYLSAMLQRGQFTNLSFERNTIESVQRVDDSIVFTGEGGGTQSALIGDIYKQIGPLGTVAGNISLNNISGAYAFFHPNADGTITIRSNHDLVAGSSFVLSAQNVGRDNTVTLEDTTSSQFSDGSTSITLRAGHLVAFSVALPIPTAPVSPTNKLTFNIIANSHEGGSTTQVQSDADETNSADPSYIQNFQKYRDLLSNSEDLGQPRKAVWSDVSNADIGDLVMAALPIVDSIGLLHWDGSELRSPQGVATSTATTGEDLTYAVETVTTITLEAGEQKTGPILVWHDAGVDRYYTAPSPQRPNAFVIGHVLNASLPGQQVSAYLNFNQQLMAMAYLDNPLFDGPNTYYVDLDGPDEGTGNRAFPFNTMAAAMTEAATVPTAEHKTIVVLGHADVGDFTNTATVGNVTNLIIRAPDATFGAITLADHATTIYNRRITGSVQLGDQCSIFCSGTMGTTTPTTITFTAEQHNTTRLQIGRIENDVTLTFAGALSGSFIDVLIERFEANPSSAITTIPNSVNVTGRLQNFYLPFGHPVFANFDGLPDSFNVLNELEGTHSVLYDLSMSDHLDSYTVVAQRTGASQNLSSSTLNLNLDGRNSGTVVFTEADITALASGSGNIEIQAVLNTGSITHETVFLGQIEVGGDSFETITATRNYVQDPPGGSFQIGDLEGKTLFLGTNAAINLGDAEFDLSFTCIASVGGTSIAGISGATVSGYSEPQAGDVVRVVREGTNQYRAYKVSNYNDLPATITPNDLPIMDTLLAKSAGDPGSDTAERLAIKANWTGSRTLRLAIDGEIISIGSVTAVSTAQVIDYTITASEWATIYTNSPTTLSISWQWDDGGSWTTFYTAVIPA